jgi:hypothetical protein
MARLTLTGETITLPEGVTHTRSHEVLQTLFGQVLAQLSEDDAFRLCEAYIREGKVIEIAIAQNSRGKEHRPAFRLGIADDWRLTETKGSA